MEKEYTTRGAVKLVSHLCSAVSRIAWGALFFMMLLTVADVFMRKVFNHSILGTVELTQFMLLVLIFFSLAQTELMDGHVKVDLIVSRFSPRGQALFDLITQISCFLLSLLMTWSTVVYAERMRASGEVSQDLWLPVYPFVYVVAAGWALFGIALFIKFTLALKKAVKP
ncbi:MAG: TRAP transporter small permease [Deltaproteobacteria bacterium]|nr:TRAP transporter small permease [Deltaproteobacteria bacterium]RLB32480.1 MAG: hypothetical protein DRH11_11535 [Deltaproteobacteria bacterium]